jgi:nucleoid-associated protein YgaU
MTRQSTRHPFHRGRIRGLALTSSAVALLVMVLIQLADLDRSAWGCVLAPGPADLDQLLSAAAGAFALALTGWLLCALLFSLLAAVQPGPASTRRMTTAAAQAIAPRILRHGVAALLGIAIAAAPVAAHAATPTSGALHPASGLSARVTSTQSVSISGLLSPAWAPTDASLSTTPKTAPSTTDAVSPPSGAGSTLRPIPASTASPIPSHLDLTPGWTPQQPPRPARATSSPRHLAVVTSPPRRGHVEPPDGVIVRRGDTLWSIAARHLGAGATSGEVAQEWPHWFTANRSVIGSDPDRLHPGDRLHAPERTLSGPSAGAIRPTRDGSTR